MASTDARPVPQKNVAYRVTFPILDADGDLVTGAATLDSEISKDGGTFADCTNEATEIATSSGMYFLDLTSTEMNADTVAIIVKTATAGAKTTPIVMYPEEAGDIRVNLTQILGTAVATPATAGILDVNVKNIDNDAASASGTVTFPNATLASTTNITAGTLTTVTTATNVTTVNGLAASVITAASIAADAITAAKVADGTIDAATFATGAITATAIAADAITAAKVADGTIDAATFAAGAINAAAIAADAITDAKVASDVTIASVTGAVGSVTGNVGGNVVGSVASVTAGVTLAASAVQAIWDALTSALTTAGSIGKLLVDNINATISSRLATAGYTAPLSAAATANAVWDEAIAGHLTAGTTGLALSSAGSAGDPWATAIPGAYGAGTAGKIVGDNVNATISSRATQTSVDDVPTNAELATALAAADDAVLAAIAALNNLSQANIRTAVGLASANLDTQLDALPTNAELATSLGTADDAVLAAIAALNNLSAAQVNAEADTALADVGLTTTITGRIDAAISSRLATAGYTVPPTAVENADALLNRDMSTGTDSGSTTVRTPRQSLRFLRNKWEITAGTLTVRKEDDTTASWSSTLTTTAGDPVSQSDPAGP